MNQKQFLELLSTMPPLPHSPVDDSPYHEDKSEVVKWLLAQPGVKNWIFSKAHGTRRIVYDRDTERWHGVIRGRPGRPASTSEIVTE